MTDVSENSPNDPAERVTLESLPPITRADLEAAHTRLRAERVITHSWPYPSGMDWLLAQLVNTANRGSEFGLTLNVGGLIITGTLISGATYLREMAELVCNSYEDKAAAENFSKIFTDFDHLYTEPKGEDGFPELVPPNYLHLRNMRCLQGMSFVPINGTLWRGRMSSIDGFSLGSISTSTGS